MTKLFVTKISRSYYLKNLLTKKIIFFEIEKSQGSEEHISSNTPTRLKSKSHYYSSTATQSRQDVRQKPGAQHTTILCEASHLADARNSDKKPPTVQHETCRGLERQHNGPPLYSTVCSSQTEYCTLPAKWDCRKVVYVSCFFVTS